MTIAIIWQHPRPGDHGVSHAWTAVHGRVLDEPPLCRDRTPIAEQQTDGTLRCLECERVAAIFRSQRMISAELPPLPLGGGDDD